MNAYATDQTTYTSPVAGGTDPGSSAGLNAAGYSGRERTASTLVVGWGSDLRGDDAAGLRVVATIDAWNLPDVATLAVHQLTPDLVDAVAAVRRVVFVDAQPNGDSTADLVTQLASPGTSPAISAHASHHVSPETLLGLAQSLHGANPEAWLVGVPTFAFDLGAPLTSSAAHAVESALIAIRNLLAVPAR